MPASRAAPACARRQSAALKRNQVFDQVMGKYDYDGDGVLEFDEVKKLLTDMLSGAMPSDDQVCCISRGT